MWIMQIFIICDYYIVRLTDYIIFANYKDLAWSGEFVFSNKIFVVHLLNFCPIFERYEMQHLCSVFGMNYFARNIRMDKYFGFVIKCLVSGTLLTTWIMCMAG